jgi:hypothetical protein
MLDVVRLYATKYFCAVTPNIFGYLYEFQVYYKIVPKNY